MSQSKRRKKEREESLLEALENRQLLSVAATVAASDVVANGATSYEFAAIFSSASQINTSTIAQGDVTVVGPGGTIVPQLVSLSPATGSAESITAVFSMTPPTGKWEMSANGTYNVDVSAGAIKDSSGSALAAGSIGMFSVNIQPSILLDNGTLVVNGTSGSDSITIGYANSYLVATENGVPTDYNPGSVSQISVVGGTGVENVLIDNIASNATVPGTPGNDTIDITGNARDSVAGGHGDDSIVGDNGNSTLTGAGGDDTIIGGRGDDSIRGGKGTNELLGHAGDDTIVAGIGADVIAGGPGNNDIFALHSTATINGGAGSDTVHAGANDSVINATDLLDS